MVGCPVSAIGDSEQWTQLKAMALGDAKFYRKENDFFASLFFFLQFVDVPFAAEWRSCNFWTSKCAHCFPRAEHLRHYGNTALGDTLGLQTKKTELPRQPLSSPYYPLEDFNLSKNVLSSDIEFNEPMSFRSGYLGIKGEACHLLEGKYKIQ
ncbi:hypothetical protein V1477_004314 [Vespula maculifrons]|uniref:Uncharacterized protein n=1 Tax=Vespula maculifrons TaxID=7453 RepID=A0ABD2CRB4_VESMC